MNTAKILFRDAEVQGQEFANQVAEDFKTALGDVVKAAPELAIKGEKAIAAYSRYKFRELSGQAVPPDWEDQVKAQIQNIKTESAIIAKDKFDSLLANAIKNGLAALSNVFGGAIGGLGKVLGAAIDNL